MKILITTFTYPPNKDGVAEASRHMAEGLAARGWEVTVATGDPEHPENATIPVRVVRFDLVKGSSTDPTKRDEAMSYRNFVRNGGFDIVVNQCWDAWSTEYLIPDLPSLPARKVMVSHGMGSLVYQWYPGPGMGIGVWLRSIWWTFSRMLPMIRIYDRIVFLSNKSDLRRFFDHALARWLGHPGIEIVPNGVDPRPFATDGRRFRERHGIEDGPIVLCVANYCEHKNQKLTLQVFQQASLENATLVFMGSEFGNYGKDLMRITAEAGIANVRFLEKQPREEIHAAFAAADAFLLTSKAETQPIVIIEAMAAGLPWVSTDTGCVSDMPGGLTGRSSSELASLLRRVISDRDLRKKLADEGKLAVDDHYSAEATLAAYDRIFRSLLS